MPKAKNLSKVNKNIEKKPATFKQDKNEFNKIYNEVKEIARKKSKGLQKLQLEEELRKRLGVPPLKIYYNYRNHTERMKKMKEDEALNLKRKREEEGVFANSLLPTKKRGRKHEDIIKHTRGTLKDGILKFDIEKDGIVHVDQWKSLDKKKQGMKNLGFGKTKNKKNKGKKKGKK